MKNICEKCRKSVSLNDNFCRSCGSKFIQDSKSHNIAVTLYKRNVINPEGVPVFDETNREWVEDIKSKFSSIDELYQAKEDLAGYTYKESYISSLDSSIDGEYSVSDNIQAVIDVLESAKEAQIDILVRGILGTVGIDKAHFAGPNWPVGEIEIFLRTSNRSFSWTVRDRYKEFAEYKDQALVFADLMEDRGWDMENMRKSFEKSSVQAPEIVKAVFESWYPEEDPEWLDCLAEDGYIRTSDELDWEGYDVYILNSPGLGDLAGPGGEGTPAGSIVLIDPKPGEYDPGVLIYDNMGEGVYSNIASQSDYDMNSRYTREMFVQESDLSKISLAEAFSKVKYLVIGY